MIVKIKFFLLSCNAENVFSMKSWCKGKFSVEESELDKQFGIPDDFDYV